MNKKTDFNLLSILSSFGIKSDNVIIEPFGSGLINNTWKVYDGKNQYILQRVNTVVFKQPQNIESNINIISEYLSVNHPGYLFVAPVPASDGSAMVFYKGNGYFRLFPFVSGSFTRDVANTPAEAYEAAAQFGRFTRLLSGLDISLLKTTIPGFHDLPFRWEQFNNALQHGNQVRKREASDLIESINAHRGIVDEFNKIIRHPEFKLRVTHHDTKISNVLFDDKGRGLCVIDLDTVMQGYFISDVGDMMRTYLCPVSEEETDLDKIVIREDFYRAIVSGYYNEMKDELTETEKGYFFYSGTFMIYMQTLRFITDYLNDDIYYGEKYPGHNLNRAWNQYVLLEKLLAREPELKEFSGIAEQAEIISGNR